jgi:hypothetical protein
VASALQCPACGHKHRLSELTGDPIFSCEQCGRLLKTPVEYRRPDASGPVDPHRSNGSATVSRGGSAKRDKPSVARQPVAPAVGAATVAPARPRHRSGRAPATLAIPLLIIGWIFALVIGGIIVRYLARFTGVLTGDSIIDLITGSGYGRYLRLFAVVPFWALVSAGLMTLFVEGARRWQARDASPSARPVKKQRMTVPPATARPQSAEPDPELAPREPAPTSSSSSSSAEERMPAGAATAPRPRRIPKRDIT